MPAAWVSLNGLLSGAARGTGNNIRWGGSTAIFVGWALEVLNPDAGAIGLVNHAAIRSRGLDEGRRRRVAGNAHRLGGRWRRVTGMPGGLGCGGCGWRFADDVGLGSTSGGIASRRWRLSLRIGHGFALPRARRRCSGPGRARSRCGNDEG
jgi:hypothetical protein